MLEQIYTGSHIEEIIGYSIAIVIINYLKGKRQI